VHHKASQRAGSPLLSASSLICSNHRRGNTDLIRELAYSVGLICQGPHTTKFKFHEIFCYLIQETKHIWYVDVKRKR
jgi:hypothetical protein